MKKIFDVIVVGLGAMGSAALYQLAKRRCDVLGIDQFSPPHHFGSTHGDTRITRQALGEGAEYVPLVLRSNEIWRELERTTGTELFERIGGLIMSSRSSLRRIKGISTFFQNTITTAKEHNIPHMLLDTDEIRNYFPQFNLVGDEEGYYEYGAGFLRPERCVEVQLRLAKEIGAEIFLNEKVLAIKTELNNDMVTVQTTGGNYIAKKVVVSAGAWVSKILGEEFTRYFRISRQILLWFDIQKSKKSAQSFLPKNFPIFIWEFGRGSMYGFPAIDGIHGGLKIGSEQYEQFVDPDSVDKRVSDEEIQIMYSERVYNRIPALRSKCLKAVSCLYTITPDRNFIIDFLPDHPNIIVASPCSGHGFKHSAAIGEVVSELALYEKSSIDISKFLFQRLLS
ncbi:MAG: N-methyl-L-tryptophan oxidase [bacterium]|nr:N-methyl-L-tryptophan oxidase [bacterium]